MMLKRIQKKIYLLLFLGLFYFENSVNLIAQVPQTKRSEQDSFLKNIRAKKKNNDLQKTRQGRKKSNSNDDWKIRIRHQIGTYYNEEGENEPWVKKDRHDVKIWSIIFNKIGISEVDMDFFSSGFYNNQYSNIGDKRYRWTYRYNVKSTLLTYTFGDKFNLTLGTPLNANGRIWVREESYNNSTNEVSYIDYFESTKLKNNIKNFFFDGISTITFGFEYSGIEFLLGISSKIDYKFTDLKCSTNPCRLSSHEIYQPESLEKNPWYDLGLGFSF